MSKLWQWIDTIAASIRLCLTMPIFAFLFAGCDQTQTVDLATGLTPVTLRIEWLHSSYHAPFFLGMEKGYYRDVGLSLTINEGQGSVQVVQLVGRGEDEFGFASSDAILRGTEAGVPILSVANIMPVMGQALYVRADSPIETLSDLKGRSIAMTPGGTNEALLPLVLNAAGLTLEDVRQISVGASAKVRTFLNGDVDAMIATGWAHSLFEAGGGARGFVFSDYGVEIVGYNIVTSSDLAERDPVLVQRFVNATLKAWSEAKANPEAAVQALARAVQRHATPDRMQGNRVDLRNALDFVAPAAPDQPYGFQSLHAWEDSRSILFQYGVLAENSPVASFVTNRFLPEAEIE
jgi:NitT/TauT family transport system substrate-binding protein